MKPSRVSTVVGMSYSALRVVGSSSEASLDSTGLMIWFLIVSMFSLEEEFKDIESKIKLVHSDSKKVEIVSVNKDVNKPFSLLLMGVDTLSTSYNADTLLRFSL